MARGWAKRSPDPGGLISSSLVVVVSVRDDVLPPGRCPIRPVSLGRLAWPKPKAGIGTRKVPAHCVCPVDSPERTMGGANGTAATNLYVDNDELSNPALTIDGEPPGWFNGRAVPPG